MSGDSPAAAAAPPPAASAAATPATKPKPGSTWQRLLTVFALLAVTGAIAAHQLVLRAPAAEPPPPVNSRCLAVGVLSASGNRQARDTIRGTWATEQGICRLHFFIGLPREPSILLQVQQEAALHRDIVIVNVAEHYRNITHQSLEIFKVAAADPEVTDVLKVDDDTFVRMPRLRAVLADVHERYGNASYYLGYVETQAGPIRDINSKWYMSPEVWAPGLYPPWAHGPGYVMSADVARAISTGGAYLALGGTIPELEDVSVGIWIQWLQRATPLRVNVLHNPGFSFSGACQDSDVITHYAQPAGQRCLWENQGQCAPCVGGARR